MAGGREVAAGGCAGPGDGHGDCGKLSRPPGQSHGNVVPLIGVKSWPC